MFWVKYKDILSLLNKYEHTHPKNSLIDKIWADNFRNTPNRKDIAYAVRSIDLSKNEDTVIRHIRDANDRPDMTNLLTKEILDGSLPAYFDSANTIKSRLSVADVRNFGGTADTMVVVDPVTGEEKWVVKYPVRLNFGSSRLDLKEKWSFNIETGLIESRILGIEIKPAGRQDKYSEGLLVKYADIQNEITAYNDAYPESSIDLAIWNSYFHSDIKPMIIK
jgi:hypothetical protein